MASHLPRRKFSYQKAQSLTANLVATMLCKMPGQDELILNRARTLLWSKPVMASLYDCN